MDWKTLCSVWICYICAFKSFLSTKNATKGNFDECAQAFYDDINDKNSKKRLFWLYFCRVCSERLSSLNYATASASTSPPNVHSQITKLNESVSESTKKIATVSEVSKPLVDASSETSSDMKPKTWANITGSGFESATTTNKPKNSDVHILEKVVKSSIKSVLESEKSKREIIVSRLPESSSTGTGGGDSGIMKKICVDIGFPNPPVEVKRLGQQQTNLSRLLKVTFQSEFEARAFKSTYKTAKPVLPNLPKIKIRRNLDAEARKAYSKKAKVVYELNQDPSKTANGIVSYSIRDNGIICKFIRKLDAKWQKMSHGKKMRLYRYQKTCK